MEPHNYYEVLGLSDYAGHGEIRKAYLKQSLIFHPDKNKDEGAEEWMKVITAANVVLGSPKEKNKFDDYLRYDYNILWWKCVKCFRFVKTRDDLAAHVQKHHNFPCQRRGCSQVFEVKSELMNHLATSHQADENTRETKATGESAAAQKRSKEFRKETDTNKKKGKSMLTCQECEKSFPCQSKLDTHVNGVHLNLKPFRCEKCDATFKRKEALKKHEDTIHAKEQKPYKCTMCDKAFNRDDHLENHKKRIHLNAKPPKNFSCTSPECGRSFESKSHLDQHNKSVHLDILFSVTCSLCASPFSSQGQLNRHHRNVHLKVKPHACQTCQKPFDSKFKKERHEKSLHPRSVS